MALLDGTKRLTRRAAMAGAVAAYGSAARAAAGRRRLLVLGGTFFLGPAIVQSALDRGHEVTLFNRGRTNPGLFPGLERIRGDRDPERPDLGGLAGERRWDAVIDVWPSNPHTVARTAALLKDRTDRYLFISTIVAYRDLKPAGVAEDAPLFDDVTDAASWYEFDKANSERAVDQIYGPRATVLRPPILAGYRQDSDTFRFWAARIARGGEVLAPGDGRDPVQFTDVKDVGAFAVEAVERGLAGPYNVVGPERRTSMRALLEGMNAACGNRARLVWVPDAFLAAQGVRFWSDLPMYLPVARVRKPGFMQVSNARALAAGLRLRPLADTVADELKWFAAAFPGREFGVAPSDKGMDRARELRVLEAWKAAQAAAA
jgi:2'-hydroxyisoflavone reductase